MRKLLLTIFVGLVLVINFYGLVTEVYDAIVGEEDEVTITYME